MNSDTVAAIASGITTAGIGIIRISGSGALAAADCVLRVKGGDFSSREERRVIYARVRDGEQEIDEALAFYMKAPHSYTGEDVVEIQCHGGPFIMKKILDAVFSAGVRAAQPGEFTKRAFLNGRIDLSQAESVMQLIGSESEYARKSAFAQLRGDLKEKIGDIRGAILERCAYLEAALDDPEHISLEGYSEGLKQTLESKLAEIENIIKKSVDGQVLKFGIKTVILGPPNAGKSTLLNCLLGRERAIVTDIPGTTRDTIEETLRAGDVVLRLVDTAGLRKGADEAEEIGIRRSYEAAANADLILYVQDCRQEGETNIEEIRKASTAPIIALLNKDDLRRDAEDEDIQDTGLCAARIRISAKTGSGIEALYKKIEELFITEQICQNEEALIANSRQLQALYDAKNALNSVLEAIKSGVPEDLYTVDLMAGYEALGQITGETADEDLINKIFADFCMGK